MQIRLLQAKYLQIKKQIEYHITRITHSPKYLIDKYLNKFANIWYMTTKTRHILQRIISHVHEDIYFKILLSKKIHKIVKYSHEYDKVLP